MSNSSHRTAGSKLSKINSKARLKSGGKDFNTLDFPVANHNLSMRQLGMQNPKKLKYLHETLEKICLAIRKRKMLANNEDPNKFASKKELWKIPYKIVAFI